MTIAIAIAIALGFVFNLGLMFWMVLHIDDGLYDDTRPRETCKRTDGIAQ